MQFIKSIFIKLICVFVLVSSSFAYAEAGSHNITKSDVIEAQKAWGEGIVNIGLAYTKKQNYTNIANKLVDELYDYDEGEVLFKPTKASEKQFRRTKEEAVSYFVKGIEPEDHGFALQPWSSVRFDNSNIIIHGDTAIAMGNYFFTDATTKKETKVEYTFGYVLNKEGKLLINVHHSSFPYNPKN